MLCYLISFFTFFLPSTSILEGKVVNGDGVGLPYSKIVVEYKSGNLMDREFYERDTAVTDKDGEFKIKLKKCWKERPVRILILAKGYIPDFYSFQSLPNRKNDVILVAKNKALKSPNNLLISNEIFGSFDSIGNSISYYLNIKRDGKVFFTTKALENSLLRIDANKALTNNNISVSALKNFVLTPIDSTNSVWLYGEPKNASESSDIKFKVSNDKTQLRGQGFVLKLNEGQQYRCFLRYYDGFVPSNKYSMELFYTIEQIDDEKFYFFPSAKNTSYFFDRYNEVYFKSTATN